jgi:RNA recognition motif-containing protein
MGRKLYVGNLPYSVTEESLTAKFAECGQVESAKLITDRDTGQSKGFAFIEMSTESEARAAIEKHNGGDFDGRPMRVNEAKPQEKKSNRGGGGFGGGRRW